MKTFFEDLSANAYPGRGILLGKSEDNEKVVIAYFIMGRSENSRNRVFVADGEGLKTQAYDESKLVDPSLIIYNPVKVFGNTTVVTNGDQTDSIYDNLVVGGSFQSALRLREFEPDAPNFTPRISGTVCLGDGGASYKMSILKAGDKDGSFCNRFFYEYQNCTAGCGYFIHTYQCDGNPIPSFVGEPKTLKICGDIEQFATKTWESLNQDNKVSLFVRFIDIATGKTQTKIINKNA